MSMMGREIAFRGRSFHWNLSFRKNASSFASAGSCAVDHGFAVQEAEK